MAIYGSQVGGMADRRLQALRASWRWAAELEIAIHGGLAADRRVALDTLYPRVAVVLGNPDLARSSR